MGKRPSRPTQLIVVRHRVPDEGNINQPGDPRLNNAGRLQASRLAERLSNGGVSPIVSSPQQRALETAQPLSELLGLPVEVLDGLARADRHTKGYRSPEAVRREEPGAKAGVSAEMPLANPRTLGPSLSAIYIIRLK